MFAKALLLAFSLLFCFSSPVAGNGQCDATNGTVVGYIRQSLSECIQGFPAVQGLRSDINPTPCDVLPWQGQTLYLAGSVVTFGENAYICTISHTSVETCAPPEISGHWHEIPIVCQSEYLNGVISQRRAVHAVTRLGLLLTLSRNFSVIVPGPSSNGDAEPLYSLLEEASLSLGREALFRYAISSTSNNDIKIWMHWGPLVRGTSLSYIEVLNGTVTGNLDGRLFAPFSFSAANGDGYSGIAFADNGTAPTLEVTALDPVDLNTTLQALQNRSIAAEQRCSAQNDSGNPLLFKRQLRNTTQDLGHQSDTIADPFCQDCVNRQAEENAKAECVDLCLVDPFACAICWLRLSESIDAGVRECLQGTVCCPRACSLSGRPRTCCGENESCLNSDGLCCSRFQFPCLGQTCCNANSQICNDNPGFDLGKCCAVGSLCGTRCCDGDCLQPGNVCCKAKDTCGNACCSNEGLLFVRQYCANRDLSLCCDENQIEVLGRCERIWLPPCLFSCTSDNECLMPYPRCRGGCCVRA